MSPPFKEYNYDGTDNYACSDDDTKVPTITAITSTSTTTTTTMSTTNDGKFKVSPRFKFQRSVVTILGSLMDI